ncbi:MAG TPA: C25 family peptidase C-terminal domain-containing protein, partial [Bacteroidales bacterium]|nr:C25 family peptidase C-terminal domain-containing protein [Bacteroidales bacterium]
GGQGQAMADTWTLFGDPSLMVRTKTPQVMNITHSGTVSVGATEFIVNCDVEGALVSLTKYENNETIIIGYAYVSGGIANVTIAPFDAPGTMKVTVTAFNKITYQEDVTVIVPEGPYIVNGGFSINDEDSNNNGVVDYNETFFINQALNNVGIADASFVTATISSTSSDVQILQESAIFGFISAGCTSTLGNAYMVSVNDGVADQTLIPFSLLVEDMENHTWIMNYNIAVNAPAMEISFYGIDDSQGNNNGMLNAGEQVILKIKVANNGHSASQAGNLHIYSSNANVALLDSEKPVIGINYGEFEIIEFELVVNEETPVGENICFDYVLNTGMYNAQSSTCLPCGLQIEDFETGDFTKYEWVNNTNRPWIIVSDVVYEGQNAAKSGQVPSSGGESVLTINLNVLNNDEIQFYKKVSCEAASSWWGQLTYWDYLSFSIDNVEKGKWAGEVNWSQETYPVTAGNHSFKWTYKKDNYVDEGSDCAWLDYIKLPNHQQAVSIVNSNVVVSQNIVNVYPNPATNHFNVYVNLTENIEAKIYVYTIDGKTVYEYSQSFEILKGENIIPINSSKFDNGIYIVKLVLENEIYTKSVIINR